MQRTMHESLFDLHLKHFISERPFSLELFQNVRLDLSLTMFTPVDALGNRTRPPS